jgi:exosortase
VLVLLAACWAYARTLAELWREWQHNENYSVGMLVPLAAVWLAAGRRHELARLTPRIAWTGLLIVIAALALRMEGLRSLRESVERYSFVVLICGLVLFLAGWQIFWRLRWLLGFLFLMVPLPGALNNRIEGPLQDYATTGTVFVLETLGLTVEREGNTLRLDGQTPVGIEEACSGLRMLTAFVVVAAVLAFMVDAPPWQRVVLVLSSAPLAVLCNIARLALTALVFRYSESKALQNFMHDFAGVAMMPLAIALLLLERWILYKLVTPPAAPLAPAAAPRS